MQPDYVKRTAQHAVFVDVGCLMSCWCVESVDAKSNAQGNKSVFHLFTLKDEDTNYNKLLNVQQGRVL